MTLDEAKNILINRGFVEINGDQVFDGNKWRNAIAVISKWLEQQPCEDCISRQEAINCVTLNEFRYKIVEDMKTLPSVTPKQQPCEDCISRQSVKRKLQEHHDFFVHAYNGFSNMPQNDKSRVDEITNCIAMVVNEPPVTPKPKTGRWIYDKKIENWRCSECNETPRTMGYVGTADFMAEHFSFCNHCGTKMQEVENDTN